MPGSPNHATLRLLAFSHSANLGGSEQLLLQLVRELVHDRQVACTIVVPLDGPLVSRLKAAGGEVWIWPTSWWCRSEPWTTGDARRVLSQGAASVVENLDSARRLEPHAVLSLTTVVPWGHLAAALLGKPHVWYVTDFGGTSEALPHYVAPFDALLAAMEAGADRVLVVSDAVRQRLFPGRKPEIEVLPPHLDPPDPTPAFRDSSDSGPIRVLVLGTLRPAKGQWDAVAALAELERGDIDAVLQVVGYPQGNEDILLDHAERLGVRDRVQVIGLVEDQRPWLANADFVLVPSHDETFSLVCLEAQLCGKPLVATRVGGIQEFVHNGINALTVPAQDPPALSAALLRLIDEPGLARRLAEAARQQATERFTSDRFSGRFRTILDELVTNAEGAAAPLALTAPIEALAEDRQALRQAFQGRLRQLEDELAEERGARVELVDVQEQCSQRLDLLQLELETEQRQREEAEGSLERLQAAHRSIAETRAWRLVQAYWRLVGRLRERS